jgi:hypothetical protein
MISGAPNGQNLARVVLVLAVCAHPVLARAADPAPLLDMPVVIDSGHSVNVDVGTKALPDNGTYSGFIGQLKFTITDEFGTKTDHYCTAEAVDNDVILTAAHCIGTNAVFSTYKFTLASAPTGTQYQPSCMVRSTNWQPPGNNVDPFVNVRFDYAFLHVSPSLGNNHLQLDISQAWFPSLQHTQFKKTIQSIGYPAAEPSGQSKPYVLKATIFEDLLHPYINAVSSSDASFTFGISGGAWIDPTTTPPSVESLNSSFAQVTSSSRGFSNSYITIYGPMFDADADFLEKFAENHTNAGSLNQCQ